MAKRTSGNAYGSERKLTRQSTRTLRIQEQARTDEVAALQRAARKARAERKAQEGK